MNSLPITVRVALAQAQLVARSNIQRAIEILLRARVAFESAVRFVLASAGTGSVA